MPTKFETTRFGWLRVRDERIIRFPKGLLGFPACTRFALIEPPGVDLFYFLQSMDDPVLAFVVTAPEPHFRDYKPPARAGKMLLVICNYVGGWLVGNLLGPIILNPRTMCARQIVLDGSKWRTRERIAQLSLNPLN